MPVIGVAILKELGDIAAAAIAKVIRLALFFVAADHVRDLHQCTLLELHCESCPSSWQGTRRSYWPPRIDRRSFRTSQLASRLRKLMPSRLTRSCPGCATSAGTERSTIEPTAMRSSVTAAARARPLAVSMVTEYDSTSSGSPAALAASGVSTTELAPVSSTIPIRAPLTCVSTKYSPLR